jgi:hypothetical protein
MNLWRHFREFFEFLAPERSRISPVKHIAALAALMAVTVIAGAVALKQPRGLSTDAWENLRAGVSGRAEVNIYDDFRQGLGGWQAHGTPAGWSYNQNGFVNVGSLSLFGPTRGLTDYDLDTLVEIETKGVGIAFRAASLQSYQAVTLTIHGSGPQRSLEVGRYAVIAGRASHPVVVRFPTGFQVDTLYRVHVAARGDAFALYVQGNLVDSWTDPQLPFGGVGLFCSPGEHGRVAWVRVSRNVGLVGRLCSLLSSTVLLAH